MSAIDDPGCWNGVGSSSLSGRQPTPDPLEMVVQKTYVSDSGLHPTDVWFFMIQRSRGFPYLISTTQGDLDDLGNERTIFFLDGVVICYDYNAYLNTFEHELT